MPECLRMPLLTSLLKDLRLAFTSPGPSPALATVFVVSKTEPREITEQWIRYRISQYAQQDDVFQPGFLQLAVFYALGNRNIELTPGTCTFLKSVGTRWIDIPPSYSLGSNVLPGPYALVGNRLCEVWKLHKDTHGTLLTSLSPDLKK